MHYGAIIGLSKLLVPHISCLRLGFFFLSLILPLVELDCLAASQNWKLKMIFGVAYCKFLQTCTMYVFEYGQFSMGCRVPQISSSLLELCFSCDLAQAEICASTETGVQISFHPHFELLSLGTRRYMVPLVKQRSNFGIL